MSEYTRVAIDTSKAVFTLHCTDATGRALLRTNLTRSRLLPFLRKLAPTEIVMEACGGSHHWARMVQALGHTVRLIPPQYVKPFVKRGKNDRNDAEAICEAANRPGIHPVPVKSLAQQAEAMVLKVRQTLVDQRTGLINTLRGHASEFGVIAAKGTSEVGGLLAAIAAEAAIPSTAKEMLALLGEEVAHLDTRLKEIGARLNAQFKTNPIARLLATIPGIGPITALTLAIEIDAAAFASARHFAAWLGLTPREHSTGGKLRLGGISRAGHERLRQLLVLGATAVVKVVERPGNHLASGWLLNLLRRKPRKLAAVALANKMARMVWAIMRSGEAYRGRSAPAGAAA